MYLYTTNTNAVFKLRLEGKKKEERDRSRFIQCY